jgi:hypothetical protein
MPVPYTFDWMALWPLVGVALTEGRNEEALEHARGMFAPTQQRLPETLAHAVEEAVRTWDGGERELAIARLRQAFPPAQELGYL